MRDLPWKGEKDPYRIWLSEIILQQTRAQQGLPYYEAFTAAYPTISDLANANDDEVFRLWQGLGYYNRCKNMLATARYIANELGGHFPESYEGLLALRGIGPYTAAAIGSFAFGLPNAVLDGNVYRVLARYFAIDTPSDTTEGKQLFAALAGDVLDPENSAAHNQAIMDLGATICTPASPKCNECPLSGNCLALSQGRVALLPVRSRRIQVKERYFNYFSILNNGHIWVHRRGENDIWGNLYELFLVETDGASNATELSRLLATNGVNAEPSNILALSTGQQKLTHQIINTTFYTLNITGTQAPKCLDDGKWVSISEIKKLAFPKTLVSFFKKKLYF